MVSLASAGLGFLGLGVIVFLFAVICCGFVILLDRDVLYSKVDKLFGVSMICWALGVACMFIDFILYGSN